MQAQEEAKFDWAKQWYPVAFVDDLDPLKPHSIELLGEAPGAVEGRGEALANI